MLTLSDGARVYIATGDTDMRLGYNGLYAIIEGRFGRPPLAGDWYVFGNRRRNRLKIFFAHEGGLCLLQKRLEQHTFHWPECGDEVVTVSLSELQLLFSGIDLTLTKRRQWWKPASSSAAAAR